MKETNGGLGHKDIMQLPFCVFLSYIEDISNIHQEKEDTNYFNGSNKLANIWSKNKDKWQQKVVN